MASRFKTVIEQQLKEISVKTIGLFPGKFKPPHIGHFSTCEKASKENDIVIVFISNKEHEGITPDMSFKIWSIYSKYLNNQNVFFYIANPTPVLACYDLANILNNGDYKDIKNSAPRSNILEFIENNKIIDSFINVGNNIKINVYSSLEDQLRFKNLKKPLYEGNNVLSIKFKPVVRITSASKFRKALGTNKNIETFIPKILNKNDKNNIINILNDNF